VILVAGVLAGIALARFFAQPSGSDHPPLRAQLSLTLPDDAPLAVGSFMPALAFSPDGESLAYVGVGKDGVRRIYVRRLDEDAARVLPGTEGAEGPFFSPDGEWIGFWSPWKVRKVRVSGAGVPEVVCDSVDFRGGTWAGETIVFTPGQDTPLVRVPDSGGRPEIFTTVLGSETGHRFPHTLPDGDTIVFSARQLQFDPDRATIATISLSSGERKDVGSGSADVRASSTGHLLYVQAGKLIAVPFDLEKLEITGEAATVVEGVVVQLNTGAAQLAVSPKGHLVWAKGDMSGDKVTIARVDRAGGRTSILETTKLHRHPVLSPDDKRMVVMAIGPDVGGAWLMSTEGTEQRRLTSSPSIAVWSPDGRWASSRNSDSSEWNLARIESVDGSTPGVDAVSIEEGNLTPSALTATGVLAYTIVKPDGDLDVWTVDTSTGGTPEPFLVGPDSEGGVAFSPDGRYAAYVSNRTGDFEVFVTTFPDRSATWQVSTTGGSEVVWRRDGKEIFFRSGQDMVAVPVTLDPSFHAGTPVVLFQGSYEGVLGNPGVPNYDAAVDGSWFLMSISPELGETAADLRIALNWATLPTK
jgi:serine/threonine-protein kinase